MSFTAYQAYRPSGLEWLGDVPRHWNVLRLKHVCEVFLSNVDKHARDDEPSIRLCNYTDVYYNERITADMSFLEATASPEQIARFTLKGGDTVITKDSEAADDIAIAAYVPEDVPGVVCGYHLAIVRPNDSTSGPFVKRLFDSLYSKAKFEVAANGLTRVGLGKYAIDNIELPFPLIEEQLAIAAFLDRETAKIDALVEEQKRLIELLKEKRHAVISHAVTKGLNPSVPMKDSGVKWLGEVPAHWSIKRLKSITPQVTVGIVVEPTKYYVDSGVPALRSLNVREGRISADDLVFISEESNSLLSKSRLGAGDLVAVRSGQPGTTAVVPADLDQCNCIDLIVIRRPSDGSEMYLCFYLNSGVAKIQFSQGSAGAIQQHFNVETAKDLVVCWPPMAEQVRIAGYLERELSGYDALTREALRAVELLEERRSALISAAVTGKIDVRGAA